MSVDVMVGLQRGDEGKGRFVDMFAGYYDIVARFNGGNNAGHTVVLPDEQVLKLHMVPSGIAHEGVVNLVGNGTLVDSVKLVQEMNTIESMGIDISPHNLKISSAAHLILPHHIFEDAIREAGRGRQGSTQTGIAPASSDKAMRTGVRAEMLANRDDALTRVVYEGLARQVKLLRRSGNQGAVMESLGLENIDIEGIAEEYLESASRLGFYVDDTVLYLNQELRKSKPARVLAEGAQAFLLDIDHGMYPYTTSTSTTAGGVCTGLGIAPSFIRRVTGVAKAVQSHVGGGPFVTEVTDIVTLDRLHGDKTTVDAEVGTTTGRTRRLGYLDLPQMRRAIMVNGVHNMILSKLDWVPRYADDDDGIPVCVAYRRRGERLGVAPDSSAKLEESTPIYEMLPSWSEKIETTTSFRKLPRNARDYVNFIAKALDTNITMVGVGPNPDQVIYRNR